MLKEKKMTIECPDCEGCGVHETWGFYYKVSCCDYICNRCDGNGQIEEDIEEERDLVK